MSLANVLIMNPRAETEAHVKVAASPMRNPCTGPMFAFIARRIENSTMPGRPLNTCPIARPRTYEACGVGEATNMSWSLVTRRMNAASVSRTMLLPTITAMSPPAIANFASPGPANR